MSWPNALNLCLSIGADKSKISDLSSRPSLSRLVTLRLSAAITGSPCQRAGFVNVATCLTSVLVGDSLRFERLTFVDTGEADVKMLLNVASLDRSISQRDLSVILSFGPKIGQFRVHGDASRQHHHRMQKWLYEHWPKLVLFLCCKM